MVYIERLISGVSSHKMTCEDMKRLPCGLANPLQFFMEIRSLGLKDNLDTTQMQLMQLLTSSPLIPPLRRQSQDLLKAAYLHREWSVA
ncbi:MAG: hypothetical protein C7B45_17770 [Sulfobacillus acidophilus]|uniref:Uncharacterized protein n=1 Tax=Sulfobacillus acidophilus TaxID=53633 RepID=A0A2T2WC84_9FIRM|nr:MAG: hypothetical protein C7B45_17770 [Sulfobacillus acidophilus]